MRFAKAVTIGVVVNVTIVVVVNVMTSMAVTSLAAQALAPKPGDDVVGLWGSETSFGPQVRGRITLERQASTWTMRVGGFEVTAAVSAGDIRIALPGGQGELRARMENRGQSVWGFWIQPPGNLGHYVSPVRLDRVKPDAWQGSVEPLEDRLSLYLLVDRNEDGSLRGSFHNPEVNWTGRVPWFRVVRNETSLNLIDPATGKSRFVQPYDSAQRQIAMDFGTPIALTPRTRDQAVGFSPRSPTIASYRYRAPLAEGDGWQTARARDVGMDEELVRAFIERILQTDPNVVPGPRIHSILVARHGKLVLEEYFYGFTADRVHDLRSASKTFTSVMLGVAMDRDPSLTIDTPIDKVFPGHAARTITIQHLLTHSSGLACDDDDDASPGNEEVMQNQRNQKDWIRYFLDLPSAHEPGTRYAYCSGGINLAAGIVAKTTATWLPDFFERYVARPLQIERYHMNLMPNGEAYGGGGIYMRPRDFLKFGQAYLNGGVWNGKRVASTDWVKSSTAHQIRTSEGGSDGFAWHRYTLKGGGREHQEYEASGNGGQMLIVVPSLDLTVVITAGNYNQYGIWRTFRDELVARYILAAVHD